MTTHHITVEFVTEHVEVTATDLMHATARYVDLMLTRTTGDTAFVTMDTMDTIVATMLTMFIVIMMAIAHLCAMDATGLMIMIV